MKRLNLGCGHDILDGYLNVDISPADNDVMEVDLNNLKLPFGDNEFDEILLSHILEHLDVNNLTFIQECHRILKPNGVLVVRVPVRDTCIQHTQQMFYSNYFRCLYMEGNSEGQSSQQVYMFKLRQFKRKRCSIREILWKIKQWIETFLYHEYEIHLEKKEV